MARIHEQQMLGENVAELDYLLLTTVERTLESGARTRMKRDESSIVSAQSGS